MVEATRVGTSSRRPLEPVARLSVAVARGPDAGALAEPPAGDSLTIGTAADSGLRLQDPTVSRYHLEVTPTREGIRVADLGSTNGTFLGAVRVHFAVVPRGTQLRIGDSVLVLDAAASGEGAPSPSESLPSMVFDSDVMREVARRVRAVAALPSPALVQGETGTGKELVTRAIHDLGPASSGPFVVVDCGALPAALLEAELFGHERGAFTGAERARAGAFERADGGSIFLDEVGELPLPAQAALLGVLERRRFRRVGGEREQVVSVRVLSATHRDLRQEVNRGAFRADLYFRLAGARIVVPPLRERPSDIPLLARHFAREVAGTDDAIGAEVLEAFSVQSWPGNVRELRRAVEQLIAFGPAELAALVSSPRSSSDSSGPAPSSRPDAPHEIERYRDAKATAISEFDRAYLSRLLGACANNVSEAARRARMDRPYLIELLKRYGLR
ncbi:MAG: sigma 54-interacting transcriptional regulator [Polyangiaceae bacterium]